MLIITLFDRILNIHNTYDTISYLIIIFTTSLQNNCIYVSRYVNPLVTHITSVLQQPKTPVPPAHK